MGDEKRRIMVRFLKAYLSLVTMMVFAVVVSIAKGSGWKILLVGLPLFLIFFLGISYQLLKEIRTLERQRFADNEKH